MPRLPPATRLLAAATLVAAIAISGCSSDEPDASPTDRPLTSLAPGTTAPPDEGGTTTSAPAATACTEPGPATPDDATTQTVLDVDGDDEVDEAWIAQVDGVVTVGIQTAAGGSTSIAFDSASPVQRSVLLANADEQGPVELLFDDGRIVTLHAFVDCEIVPVTNPEGETYAFGLGFTDVGTGVGCVETDDGPRLAGLDATDDGGSRVAWTSTVVDLDETTAKNGATRKGTFTRPADDARIELLHEVTCGEQTIAEDGLSLPE